MRRLGLGLLATSALVTSVAEALAASPAPRPSNQVSAPQFDPWMGWYAGVNLGGSWGRARSDFILSSGSSVAPSGSVNPDGVIGGGQLGYNWHLDPNWLIGVEGDIQGSGEAASTTRFDTVDVEGVTTAYQAKVDWFGTIRGRVGYAFDRRILLYATGGLAYGGVSISGTSSDNNSRSTAAFSNGNVNTGWTAGGGVEGVAWNPQWTWKIEYLYLDLGSVDTAVSSGFTKTHTTTNFTDNVLRGGLNFHFH